MQTRIIINVLLNLLAHLADPLVEQVDVARDLRANHFINNWGRSKIYILLLHETRAVA